MMKYFTVQILLFVVFQQFCKGQDPPEPIKNSIAETMANAPVRIVRQFIQDRKGNIWIATHEGVFRYDGRTFTNITAEVSPPRLGDGPENRFYAVLEDSDGNFWFASTDNGVYYYNGKVFRHLTTADGLPSNRVIAICQDRTGNLWFGTMGGLSRYDGKVFQNFTTKEGLPDNDVSAIVEDKSGRLWVGMRGGLCTYDGKSFNTVTKDSGEGFENVRSIIEDREGNIWLGSNGGLWRYNGTTFTNYTVGGVPGLTEDKKGNIWICSSRENGRGWTLSRIDAESSFRKTTTVAESDNTSAPILAVFEDSDGVIWFGCFGIYRYNGNTISHFVP